MYQLYPTVIDREIWTGKLSLLKSATAKISSVDDRMIVKVNGVVLVDADYGYSNSFEFKDKLKAGENLIDVSIVYSEYGGCSVIGEAFYYAA